MATPDTGLSEQAILNRLFDPNNNALNVSPGLTLSTPSTLIVSGTTGQNILFGVTGSVEIRAIYGVVTTVLSNSITAAHLRINDQTAQPVITLVTGTALSSAAVGSVFTRTGLVATAIDFRNAAAGLVYDPIAATAPAFHMPFVVTQKTGGVQTDIEFRYTTANTPATGVIQWYVRYVPLTPTSLLTAKGT